MAELDPAEKDAISHRGRAAGALAGRSGWRRDTVPRRSSRPRLGQKERAARLSIASNTSLIVLKLVAGAATGSIAIVTEAVHSAST